MMQRRLHKILILCFGLTFMLGLPLQAQKLYKQFEKGNYSKIVKVLEKKSLEDISDAQDLKACASVLMMMEDYKSASKYYAKALSTDESVLDDTDYYNYAYSLLESGQSEKLGSLESKSSMVGLVEGIKKFRDNNKIESGFETAQVDLLQFLPQYGISSMGDSVLFTSPVFKSVETNNFETTKAWRRYSEYSMIKSFDLDSALTPDIQGRSFAAKDFRKSNRIVTSSIDTLKNARFYTKVAFRGQPGKIYIKGGYDKFPENSRKYACIMPYFDSTDSTLYYSSDVPGGSGGLDIYKSQWRDGAFEEPVNMTAINTPMDEIFPHSSPWGLAFASNGQKGLGGFDNYVCVNDTVKNLVEFNTTDDDFCLYFVLRDTFVAIGVNAEDIMAYFYDGEDFNPLDPKLLDGDNGMAYLLPSSLPEEEPDTTAEDSSALPLDIDFGLELMYGLDKYELTESNKIKVDEFLDKVRQYAPEGSVILVQGSADGVGTTRYNDYISFERAETLVAYMEENIGDFDVTFKELVLGELTTTRKDSCSLRKNTVNIPEHFPVSAPLLYAYRTEKGQSLEDIATLFGMSMEDLDAMNPNVSSPLPEKVFVTIQTIMRVKYGTTLGKIAKEYGCSVEDIIKINKKTNSQIREKEVLVIPVKH